MTFLREVNMKQIDALRLLSHFQHVDDDGNGTIDIREFFEFFEVERSDHNITAFQVLSFDDQARASKNISVIDFSEFVLSMYSYCTLSHSTLVQLGFRIISNGKEYITPEDMNMFVANLFSSSQLNIATQSAARLFSCSKFEIITWENFNSNVKKMSSLLYPAFRLQKQLRSKVLSSRFWQIATERRNRNSSVDCAIKKFAEALTTTKREQRRLAQLLNPVKSPDKKSFTNSIELIRQYLLRRSSYKSNSTGAFNFISFIRRKHPIDYCSAAEKKSSAQLDLTKTLLSLKQEDLKKHENNDIEKSENGLKDVYLKRSSKVSPSVTLQTTRNNFKDYSHIA